MLSLVKKSLPKRPDPNIIASSTCITGSLGQGFEKQWKGALFSLFEFQGCSQWMFAKDNKLKAHTFSSTFQAASHISIGEVLQ
jgi:hypothetical protein